MRSELSILKKENKLRKQSLEDTEIKTINRMMKYMWTKRVHVFELEVIHKELIGMALEAKERGETLREVLGSDEKAFCDEMTSSSRKNTFKEYVLMAIVDMSLFMAVVLGMQVFVYGPQIATIELTQSTIIFLPVYVVFMLIWNFFIDGRFQYKYKEGRCTSTVLLIIFILMMLQARSMFDLNIGIYVNVRLLLGVCLGIWAIVKLYYINYINGIAKTYQWQD